MYIFLDRKKYELKDISFQDFIDFVKNNKQIKLQFNFENKNIIGKFKKAYDKLCNTDGCLTKWECKKIIYDAIELHCRTTNPAGLREREVLMKII